MDLQITGHNIEVLPTVRAYLDKKLAKLGRHLPSLDVVKVDLTEQKTKSQAQHFRAQITLEVNGTLLRAEEQAENVLVAIDQVVPALDRQIERYKGKLYKKSKASIAARAPAVEALVEEGLQEPRIVRTKRFPVKMMTPEEAVDQMELLGHDFFLVCEFFHEGNEPALPAQRRQLQRYRACDGVDMTRVIGLTGGMGSGKSTVSHLLSELGAVVIDADKVGHEAYQNGTKTWHDLVNAFGRQIVATDGSIDRKKLGAIVFGSPEQLERLNRIVHPRMFEMMKERIEQLRKQSVSVVVLDAAILFEANWTPLVDEVWVVVASEEVVVARAIARTRPARRANPFSPALSDARR